ncbi:hypothetical protein L596_012427 [Steinernema carpocapsae]|uniref:Uncharacterized protein n=1 Tax=Steinernema carpocapsae TaxID=34508 RepID=A0A4U5NX53_STECR|nr:hypothetical protein L596_012427 [Steinernema carpocapsae]
MVPPPQAFNAMFAATFDTASQRIHHSSQGMLESLRHDAAIQNGVNFRGGTSPTNPTVAVGGKVTARQRRIWKVNCGL